MTVRNYAQPHKGRVRDLLVFLSVALSLSACSSATPAASNPSSAGSSAPAVSRAGSSPGASTTAGSLAYTGLPPDWSYTGDNGPANWNTLSAGCADGPQSSQSPIDIESSTLVPDNPASSGALTIDYLPTVFGVENTGKTIEGVPADLHADFITIDGSKYYLQQFHFHNPSEHTVDSQSFGAELHLVNKSDDGAFAVLGVLLDTRGANAPLAELFDKMPIEKADDQTVVALDEKINPAELIPAGSTIARYSGSLTTPPCTEPVIWSVFLTPASISSDQLAALSAIVPGSHRPVQPLNGRIINDVQGS